MMTQHNDHDGNSAWERLKTRVVPLSPQEPSPPSSSSHHKEAEGKSHPTPMAATGIRSHQATAQKTRHKARNEHSLPPLVVGDLRRRGLGRREEKAMRSGDVLVDRRLDLHGLSLTDARLKVHLVVQQAYKNGHTFLHIITGKGDKQQGSGVIREAFCRWLNEPHITPMVIALCHAVGRHGGEGAFYVRLKRVRGHKAR
ncbi:MAG: Smr/MutS family protein [Alphaproteobacteria bacterium GM7ARS4]|nr:Smr/MutS family protein [Alphaproteobacteria bacterium GM7ARS4]